MKLASLFISVIFSLTFSLSAFAHGEESPGPHNGYIKMLGTFHVEAAADTDGSFHVFLLDVNFTNPTIKNSSVEMAFVQGGKKQPFKCEVMGNNHFHCKPQGKYNLSSGKLFVKAKREGAEGEGFYDLPLKWQANAEKTKTMDHSNH